MFSVLLALRLPRLGKRELILVLFVRLIDLCLFGILGFLFLLMTGKGCGLWLWHSLDFSLTFFALLYFVLVIFSPFSIAITLLGEERPNLSAFRMFVRFVLFWFYLFPHSLPLGVWEGLRLVIVALPGLFSYLLCNVLHNIYVSASERGLKEVLGQNPKFPYILPNGSSKLKTK